MRNKLQIHVLFQNILPILILIMPVLTLGGLISAFTVAQAGSSPVPEAPVAPQVGEIACLPSSAGCTANDVRIEEMKVVEVIHGCTGDPAMAEARFRVMVSAVGSPNRYDIGIFFARNGNSVIGNTDCYHDYYEPPLTTTPTYGDFNSDGYADLYKAFPPTFPFPPTPVFTGFKDLDSDACGDIEGYTNGTQIFKILDTTIAFLCVDTINSNGDPIPDGYVDMSSCASWDNNGNTTCNGVHDAMNGTPSKCSCKRQNLSPDIPMPPTAITFASFTIIPNPGNVVLNWETALELNALGFNIYRSDSIDGERVQINTDMIASQSLGGTGAIYQFIDSDVQSGVVYYWLEFMDFSGKEVFGPLPAVVLGNEIFLPFIQGF